MNLLPKFSILFIISLIILKSVQVFSYFLRSLPLQVVTKSTSNNRFYIVKPKKSQTEVEDEDSNKKKLALDLLDCLTSPTESSDPEYNVEKDVRRDNLLLSNDYHNLKLELKERGLSTGGDKIAMIIRLLLHIIDPALDYNKL